MLKKPIIKHTLFISLPLVILIGSILCVFFYSSVKLRKEQIRSVELEQVKLHTIQTASFFKNMVSDLFILVENHELFQLANQSEDYSSEELQFDLKSFIRVKGIYDQIRILDLNGQELLHVDNELYSVKNPESLLQNKSHRYYFQEMLSLNEGEVFISPLDLNVEEGKIERPLKPVVRIGTPFFNRKKEKQGIVIINILAKTMLDDFKQNTKDKLGSYSLLNCQGYWLSSVEKENEWGFMLEERKGKAFSLTHTSEWARIKTEDEGQMSTTSGVYTFSTIFPQRVIGNSETVNTSKVPHTMTKESQEFWKTVSFISTEQLSMQVAQQTTGLITRLTTIYFLILLMSILGAYFYSKARIESEDSKARIELLLQSAEESIFGLDMNGLCTFVNKACLLTLGYIHRDQVLGKVLNPMFHEKDSNHSVDEPTANNSVQLFHYDKRDHSDGDSFLRVDGSHFPVEYWSRPVMRNGKQIGIVVTFLNITKRKADEEKVFLYQNHLEEEVNKRTKELTNLNNAIEQLKDTVMITDSTGVIEYANPVSKKMTGYTKQELLGKHTRIFQSGLHKKPFYDELWDTIRRGDFWQGELTNKRKSGELYCEEMSISCVRGENNEITQYIAVKRDITRQKQAAREFKFNLSLLEALQEASVYGVLVTDTNNNVIFNNHRLVEMWHIPDDVMQLKSVKNTWEWIETLVSEPRRYRLQIKSLVEDTIRETKDEIELLDGRIFEGYTSPLLSEEGDHYGRIWYFNNITDRIQKEIVLKKALKEAKEVNRLKSLFLSTMNHELRTPLNAIIGFSDLLVNQFFGPLNEKQIDYVKRIDDSGQHLLMLINDLLDIASIDASVKEVHAGTCQPKDVIDAVMGMVAVRLQKTSIKIETSLDPLGRMVDADTRMFKQILMNLLSNAIKYAPEKSKIQLNTFLFEESFLKIEIRDSGIGIEKDQLEKIFWEFHQVDRKRDEALGGTGIGLALSKRLVELLGGTIGAESTIGEGSTFWFTLPLTGEHTKIMT